MLRVWSYSYDVAIVSYTIHIGTSRKAWVLRGWECEERRVGV